MSDKPFNKLNTTDQAVRRTTNVGMFDGTRLTIEFISGFEKFNTRPYHNHETWGQGWRITDPVANVTVEREDLDDALKAWQAKLVVSENPMPELPTLWVDEYGEMEIVKLRPVRWCLSHDSPALPREPICLVRDGPFVEFDLDCEFVEGGLWLPKEQT